jgi:hypothetical protein
MATKRRCDPIRLAHEMFLESIGELPRTEPPAVKDPAAVALGKCGAARDASLAPTKRSQIAANGAKTR